MTTKTRSALQAELRRRMFFPATSEKLSLTVPQEITVADLEAELAKLPAEQREWHEWELALAREHYLLTPNVPFVRQVKKL